MHKVKSRSNADYIVIRLLTLILFSWVLTEGSTARAQAEEFCALTLNVVESGGLPIRRTWVELVDKFGNVELREETVGPSLKICDFDFGPHTLRIGTNECLPVAVSNLRLVIGSPLHLNVILNPCGYRERMGNACLLYVRVADRTGRPVPNTQISIAPIPAISHRTDSFGRYQALFQGSRDVVLTKDGFNPAVEHVQCKENEELDVKVIMKETAR